MKKVILIATALTSLNAQSATFESLYSGEFNDALIWQITYGYDIDGIPDSDDNILISAGTSVACSTDSSEVKDLTIEFSGELVVNAPFNIKLNGAYLNNGEESGNGIMYFKPSAYSTIAGSGIYSTVLQYVFLVGGDRTILNGTTINKTGKPLKIDGCTVTNQGELIISNTTFKGIGNFKNDTGGILKITDQFAFYGNTLNATAPNNSVYLLYNDGNIIRPYSGVYCHLFINNADTLRLNSSLTIDETFNILPGAIFCQNNNDIIIKGNINNQGNYVHSPGGNMELSGVNPILLNASGNMEMGNLIINSSSTVKLMTGSYFVRNSLTLSSGTLDLNNKSFTLVSDSLSTAIINPVGYTANVINGNMTLERFISARQAGFSDISSSVGYTTFDDWDNELHTIYALAPPMWTPSAFSYIEATADYYPILSPSTPIVSGKGFEFYIDQDSSGATSASVKLNSRGIPTMGTVNLSANVTSLNDGMNLVGNPYHAHISWDAVYAASSGVSADITIFDEVIQDYQVISAGSGQTLAPNQGFWISVTGIPTFMFTEFMKTSSNSSSFRHAQNAMFGLRLKSEGGIKYTSGTQFRFTKENEKISSFPFRKINHNDAPSLSSIEGNKNCKVRSINSNLEVTEILLSTKVGVEGIYSISAENLESAITEGYNTIELIDNKLHKTINLNEKSYSFTAKINEMENRFTLRLSKSNNNSSVNPLNSNKTNIYSTNNGVSIEFSEETENNVMLSFTNTMGQEIIPSFNTVTGKNKVLIQLPENFNGIYFITLKEGQKSEIKKLFK